MPEHKEKEKSFTFKIPVKNSAQYAVYYYIPKRANVSKEAREKKISFPNLADSVSAVLSHADGSTDVLLHLDKGKKILEDDMDINAVVHRIRSWIPLGTYRFEGGNTYTLTVNATRKTAPVAADAVLLVPVK